jgi:hypothetical protein
MVGDQTSYRAAVELVPGKEVCKGRPHVHAHIHTCLQTILAVMCLGAHANIQTQKQSCAHARKGRYEACVHKWCW